MSLYIGSIVVLVTDLDRAVAFWSGALGYVVRNASADFAVLTDPRRRWANLSLQRAPEPKRGRNRLHLDLYTQDREAEVARLEALGATRLPRNEDPSEDFVVLTDPDGNEFCVVRSPYTQEG